MGDIRYFGPISRINYMTIPFTKLSATGNDFVVIDHRNPFLRESALPEFVRQVCVQHIGVGSDGVLLLENSETTTYRMKYFNADGSRATMCGNGSRALGWFARHQHLWDESATFIADDGDHLIQWKNNQFGVSLNIPADFEEITLPDAETGYTINTGVPHLVLFSNDVEEEDVYGQGRMYRYSEQFTPQGTNVDFVEVDGNGLQIRTYERGVEQETLACGTGATAAAIVASAIHNCTPPITLQTHGGILTITRENGAWMLWGTVDEIYRGKLVLGGKLAQYLK